MSSGGDVAGQAELAATQTPKSGLQPQILPVARCRNSSSEQVGSLATVQGYEMKPLQRQAHPGPLPH